jgi:uncharacterized cofD-like protein
VLDYRAPRSQPDARVVADRALRIVAFGGGTGLPVLLRGLRDARADGVTAVVTVADDGGSSGRLRQELGISPPGDIRRCLIALASRKRLAEVFDYRFEAGENLRDHTVGNLIIAALVDMSGGFAEGVERAGRFLRARGRVLPAAVEPLTLVVRYADGTESVGESTVRDAGRVVERVRVEPAGAAAPARVLEAIAAADVVVLSPGSLFTSTIPALMGDGVPDALARFGGRVVYCGNLMTQPGETAGLTLSDHLKAIAAHVGPVVTDVVVHGAALPAPVLERYGAEGAGPLTIDAAEVERMGLRLHEAVLTADTPGAEARHDPARLARAVQALARDAAASR